MKNRYTPHPIDTSDVVLSPELVKLANLLSTNVHDVWAVGRIQEGWTYGPARDDARKETPCMVPFKELSDSEKAYVAPLKEEITGKEEHKFGYATSHWDGELVKKISREELKASWEKMSEQSADAPLRQAVKEYNEPMLRELLSAKDQVNEYLKASQNFVSKGIKNDYGTTEEDKKIAGTINSNPTPNTDAIRVVSEFFENWEYGLGWLDAPNKRSEKLPYRVIRHLFFLILGLNDPLYGSADDLRALLIQLGFALEMPSAEIDTLLKDSGLAGIDYKANEIILAYAADHFTKELRSSFAWRLVL